MVHHSSLPLVPGSGQRLADFADIADCGNAKARIGATPSLSEREIEGGKLGNLLRDRRRYDGRVRILRRVPTTFALRCDLSPFVVCRGISWHKGVSEPEIRLAQAHPENE